MQPWRVTASEASGHLLNSILKMMEDLEASQSEQEEEMTQEQRNEGLLQAAKENDVEMVEEYINKQAIATYEKEGWNPLLWAACNGNEEIVRLLIKANAHTIYIQQQQKSEESLRQLNHSHLEARIRQRQVKPVEI